MFLQYECILSKYICGFELFELCSVNLVFVFKFINTIQLLTVELIRLLTTNSTAIY